MPSAPSAPAAPDPNVVAANQSAYNTKALRESQAATQINQNTPTGSLNYVQTGTDQYGNPTYTLRSQLSPEQQSLLTNVQNIGNVAGSAGTNLISDAYGQYSSVPNIFEGADSLTQQRMAQHLAFQDPFNKQDTSWLDNQLRNQGILPGTPAYDAQMNRLQAQQGRSMQEFEANILPQSFSESMQNYQLPLQTATQLMQLGQPSGINPQQTPSYTQKPVDYGNITNQAYQNEMARYQQETQNRSAMLNGIFGIGGAILGMPSFGLGSSFGSQIGNIFRPMK